MVGAPNIPRRVAALPLWQQLPAVEAGDVTTLDRLGHPGFAGLIRLDDDLAQIAS
jgi:hypothetical protein